MCSPPLAAGTRRGRPWHLRQPARECCQECCHWGRTRALGRPLCGCRGESATLAPHAGRPLAEAVELRVGGGQPAVMPLVAALQKLGLQWRAVDDDGEDDATQVATAEAAEANAEAAAPLREEWALIAADEPASKAWERVSVLCAMGVARTPDGGGTT
eukprot:321771-Pleurochrysis_carterae.AAC.1